MRYAEIIHDMEVSDMYAIYYSVSINVLYIELTRSTAFHRATAPDLFSVLNLASVDIPPRQLFQRLDVS